METANGAGRTPWVLPRERAGCEHLASESSAAVKVLLKRYAAGLRWGRRIREGKVRPKEHSEGDAHDERPAKRRTLEYPTCATCRMDLRRPFVCLECMHAACLFHDPAADGVSSAKPAGEVGASHICLHLTEAAHAYACDIIHGTLFCAACDDVVYDPRFDAVRRCENGRSCVPRADEAALDKFVQSDAFAPRGLRNMGSTCFLNVILQSFIHNPLLRNYFLSDRHNAALCSLGKECLACEMDKLYAEFFAPGSGKGPYGPTTFLYAIWMDSSSSELSQTGQHDAHEMFISALNGVHNALTQHAMSCSALPHFPIDDRLAQAKMGARGKASSAHAAMDMDHGAACPCVVHRTFCGLLQSSVTCLRCGSTTHTKEPFLDLSLDVRKDDAPLEAQAMELAFAAGKKRRGKKDEKEKKVRESVAGTPSTQPQSVLACLARYCAPEQLPEASYRCSDCQHRAGAVKQLALLQLPPVLCIQLKRFEHSASAAKVDVPVQFPLSINVRDCCVDARADEGSDDPRDAAAHAYDLFTVVVHEGTMTSGHYTNFSKWKNETQWFRFDDDKVAKVHVAQVLGARAYQLFYVRRTLWNHASHGIHV
ncbi:ubiquitinyl hydrolase 1 [Malassezia sp. CBS 17886]|nr:ubiquitinyl hydrolase 1 [Malassezia sp. CBS 17886]